MSHLLITASLRPSLGTSGMSVNTLEPTTKGPFTLLQDEQVLTGPHPADIELRIPATISGPKRTENAKGSLIVTDKRVVFTSDTSGAGSSTAPPAYDAPPVLRTLAIPYSVLLATKFELPIFSANYILLHFLPDPAEPDSGLPAPGRGAHLELKVCVNDGQGHGVWKRIEGERCRLEERRADDELLPAYQA